MIYTILYLESLYKARFGDLRKRVENEYVLNKEEYPSTVISVQSLLLNSQHKYNNNRKYQSQGVSNQLMFTQHGKTGDDEGEKKREKNLISLDHITFNDCGGKVQNEVNSGCSTKTKLE